MVSSSLHGFNTSLSLILLSLSFYMITEYECRIYLSETFKMCIERRNCCSRKIACRHRYQHNSIVVQLTRISLLVFNMCTLTYLGFILDNENAAENYWSQVYYWNHICYVLIFVFCKSKNFYRKTNFLKKY